MSIESKLPAALQKKRAALFQELTKIGEAAGALAGDREAFRQLPATKLTPSTRANAQGFADREISLLQSEIRVINSLGELHSEYLGALSALHTAAYAALDKSMADVRKRLVSIGYHDVLPDDPDPSKIQPGWIFAHPDVRDAKILLDEIGNAPRDFPLAMRLEKSQDRLETLKKRIAA